MKKYWYDLHIHTCLSPCADDDMTPCDIAQMARLKGLDIIAVTDHNSGKNLRAVKFASEQAGILFIPGIEATTREEAHVLCYFKTLEDAIKVADFIYEKLPELPNKPDSFGNQYIYNENDKITGQETKLLMNAADIGIDSLIGLVKENSGVCVPAHIDRPSFSVISNLGTLDGMGFSAVEISKNGKNNGDMAKDYLVINSSDAHSLGDIAERGESFFSLSKLSAVKIIELLSKKVIKIN